VTDWEWGWQWDYIWPGDAYTDTAVQGYHCFCLPALGWVQTGLQGVAGAEW